MMFEVFCWGSNKKALVKNSVNDWIPKTLTLLVHCRGDDQIPYEISRKTAEEMYKNGAMVDVFSPDTDTAHEGLMGHGECFFPSLEFTARFMVDARDE